jgi:hypothetical protein
MATFSEVTERFGTNDHRKRLLVGMKDAFLSLKKAGCVIVYLDGSFITSKELPKDYDCCWEPKFVDLDFLDRLFVDCSRKGRERQKFRFGGEFFPSSTTEMHSTQPFLSFFQTDAETGEPKGIIAVNLGDLQ